MKSIKSGIDLIEAMGEQKKEKKTDNQYGTQFFSSSLPSPLINWWHFVHNFFSNAIFSLNVAVRCGFLFVPSEILRYTNGNVLTRYSTSRELFAPFAIPLVI